MALIHTFLAILLSAFLLKANSTESDAALVTDIHSPEIRHIMRKMNVLLYEREHTHLELQRLRRQQLLLLVEATQSLARAAREIPRIESLDSLDEEQQAIFSSMAGELEAIARQLASAQETGHEQELEAGYSRLQRACNTCHRLFRSR